MVELKLLKYVEFLDLICLRGFRCNLKIYHAV